MAETTFYPDLNKFCMEWVTPIPGNTTLYGGPIRTGSETFRNQFRYHQQSIFEQLLLFDTINFSISGPNVIIPLLYRSMGAHTLEQLLEQDALTFVVWTPTPMISSDETGVRATFTGRIGDGNGSELDIEQIVDNGLAIQDVNMPDAVKVSLKYKLLDRHTLLEPSVSETVWNDVESALADGDLEYLGLKKRREILNSPIADIQALTRAADAVLDCHYTLHHGMISYNNAGTHDLFAKSAKRVKSTLSQMEKFVILAEYNNFPNLKALYNEIEVPFKQVAKFRTSKTATKFRNWISADSGVGNEIDLIREYVNECSGRRKLFESATAKFLKLASMVAIGHYVLPASHVGELVGAALASVPQATIDAVADMGEEFGL